MTHTLSRSEPAAGTGLTQTRLVEVLRTLVDSGLAPPFVPAYRGSEEPGTLDGLDVGDIAGRTVLDIGSNLGLRCFQAAAMGAARVVGIDANADRVRQARALARALGIPAEFHHMNADDALPAGPFSVVLCFDCLHRSSNPTGLLQRLGSVARELVVIETPDLDHPTTVRYLSRHGWSWWQRRWIGQVPAMIVGRNGPAVTSDESRFFLSRSAIRVLLEHHQRAFASVRITGAGRPGVFRAVARRHAIRRLILIAGASGVGKTTFIERVRTGALAAADLERLGLDDRARGARVIGLADSVSPADIDACTVWLHADLHRWVRSPLRRSRDDALQLIRDADEVRCITLWADPQVIRQRKADRVKRLRTIGLPWTWRVPALARAIRTLTPRGRRALRDLRVQQEWDLEMGSEPSLIRSMYAHWLSFAATLPLRTHHVLDTTGNAFVLRTVPELRRLLDARPDNPPDLQESP